MEILVANRQNKVEFTPGADRAVTQVLLETALQFNLPQGTEVSIALVDDEEIRVLNRDYRGLDVATDVLSFAFDDETQTGDIPFATAGEMHILGDIVISLERALSQAREYGHSFERELGFLTIHGMLHLLGFDHQEEEEERAMRDWEEKILQNINLGRELL